MYSDRGRGRGGFGSRGRGHSNGSGWGNSQGQGGGGWGDEEQDDGQGAGGSGSTSMSVASNKVGRIIGKGGSKIRELQEQSGCRIQVTDGEYEGERQIELKGSSESQDIARQLIEELTRDDNYRGGGGGGGRQDTGGRYQQGGRSRGGYDSGRDWRGGNTGYGDEGMDTSGDSEFVMELPSNKVGRVIGKGGSKIRELREHSGCRIHVNDQKQVELRGSYDAVEAAKRMIEELIQDDFGGGGFSQGGGGGYGGGGFSRGRGRSYGGDQGGFSGGSSTRIEVPSNKLGKIIGKGGSKIRELQEESGARIKILSEEEANFVTPIELRGSDQQSDEAKRLIEELCEEDRVQYSGQANMDF